MITATDRRAYNVLIDDLERSAVVEFTALSLWQPWASLLVHGRKRVETRSWHSWHRGPLFIHATASFPRSAAELCQREPFLSAIADIAPLGTWREDRARLRVPPLPLGSIVGLVNVTHWYSTDQQEFVARQLREVGAQHERQFGDYSPGRFCATTSGAVALDQPIPAAGGQRLWRWRVGEAERAVLLEQLYEAVLE